MKTTGIVKRGFAILAAALGAIALAPSASATFNTNQGFETDTGDWSPATDITRVPSGTGGVPSSSGGYHAEIHNQHDEYLPGYGEAGYSRYGSSDPVYHGAFYQSVDVYINASWPATVPSYADSFWIDMTPYHADPNNYGAEHSFRLKALGSSVEVRVDGIAVPITTLTATGWYTFEMTFSRAVNLADPVVTAMNVYNSTHTLVATTTVFATSPGGPFASSDLRGNGYVWFAVWPNGVVGDVLAIDNLSTGLIPAPVSAAHYVVNPPLLTTGTTPFVYDPDSVPPDWASGAPTSYGDTSFYASVLNSGTTAALRYRTLRILFDFGGFQLFGRPITMNQVAGFSYWTRKAVNGSAPSAIDWRTSIYTKPTGSGDFKSWYHNRIQTDTYTSFVSPLNVNAPANQWNQWVTSGTQNKFQFYDVNRFGYSPPAFNWSDVTSGAVTSGTTTINYSADGVMWMDIQLGTNSGGGTGASHLDGVRITLTTGEVADIDLSGDGKPVGSNVVYLQPTDASLYIKPSDTCIVDLNVANLLQPVAGLQAVMNFSSTYFQSGTGSVGVGLVPGGGIWTELIYDQWNVGGDLDVAIGVDFSLSAGTQADATTAIITLHPTGTEGITQMVFRPDGTDVQTTLLASSTATAIYPAKVNSTDIYIDGTPPVMLDAGITATELQPYIASPVNVKNSANVTVQGTVDIAVQASDALAGLEGAPTIVLTNGTNTGSATLTGESPAGTFNYAWIVTPATANGLWTATVTATDKAGNVTTQLFTLLVNANQITGQVELEGFVGTGTTPAHTRTVTFVATGGATKIWNLPLFVSSGGLFSFTLTDVPAGTTGLSAKTAWTLRVKLPIALDVNGQAVSNFTGTPPWSGATHYLRGGDINGTNSINVLDYSLLKLHWFGANPPVDVADITGDGAVNNNDYNIMKGNWFQVGDPQ